MDRPKQILIINQYFAPSTAATAVLLRELVEDISVHFSVTVLCESSADSEEVGARYRVERRPLPSWIPEKRAVTSKALRWLSSFIFFVRALFYLLTSKRADLVVLASEPPFMDLLGGLACLASGQRFVIVTQDLYPEFAQGARLQLIALFAWPLKKLHSFVARKASRVIAISADHAELLARRGVHNTTIIPNWAPSIVATPEPLPMPPADGPMIIQYSGNLGLACDLNALEIALKSLASQGDLSRFKFILRGDGIKRSDAKKIASQYENVSYQTPVEPRDVRAAMAACHAHLILMPPRLYGCVYPSKANSIMAVARPIIGSVPRTSNLSHFISSHGVGYVSSAEDPSQLALCILKALRDLRDNPGALREMGARGWHYVSHEWNRSKATVEYQFLIRHALEA